MGILLQLVTEGVMLTDTTRGNIQMLLCNVKLSL
jgi:hypothetical protein